MDSNRIDDIQEKIRLYFSNAMSEQERLLFEKQMKDDSELEREVLIQKSIGEVLFDKDFNHIQRKDSQEIDNLKKVLEGEDFMRHIENIENSGNDYHKNNRRKSLVKKLIYYSSIAAIFIVVFFVYNHFNQEKSLDHLYANYADWNELPSYIEQSQDQGKFVQGEILYNDKQFADAIIVFESFKEETDDPLYAPALLYLGASYFQAGERANALTIYDTLINSNSYDNSKGYWYKLLIYLNQQDEGSIESTLQSILSDPNNYNYQQAKEIWEILDK